MRIRNSLCGFECIFAKKTDVWTLFSFSNISLENYYFSVVDAAVFLSGRKVEILNEFSANYFQEFIGKSFAAESLVLHLYPQNVGYREIDNYKDFLESPCEMIILLYDFYYVEIYCKNQTWIQKLLHTASKLPDVKIEKKHENTDVRTTMYV